MKTRCVGCKGACWNGCERNAQHGQNRTGVEVDALLDADDFSATWAIDTRRADECIADEGAEILARIHARANDVVSASDG